MVKKSAIAIAKMGNCQMANNILTQFEYHQDRLYSSKTYTHLENTTDPKLEFEYN